MLGVPDFDVAFVSLNRQLAANCKAALANHPDVLFTAQQGANHGAAAWGITFSPRPSSSSTHLSRLGDLPTLKTR
jgi:hypothetical protein